MPKLGSCSRALHLAEQEPQIVAQLVEAQRLVVHHGVDAEAARVGTPEAADQGDHFDGRGLGEGGLDELPPFCDGGEFCRLVVGGQVNPQRSMGLAVRQNVADDLPVGISGDVVEILDGVVRIAPRVRPAQHGDGAPLAAHVADGVGELCCLGERRDELESGVANELDVVPGLLAPHRHDLRHDACEIGVHDPGVQRLGGPLRDEVDDGDLEFLHEASGRRNR